MEQKINILYIGRHPEITATVIRLLNNNENWTGMGTTTDAEATALFTKHHFTIVLLGCGINREEEVKLKKFFKAHNPQAIIVQHYGGGSGLLYSEITMALSGTPGSGFLL